MCKRYAFFLHFVNNTVFIAKRETNSHMGYSDFFGHHFIITKRYHFFAETAVTFGLDQNLFVRARKPPKLVPYRVYLYRLLLFLSIA